MSVRVQVIAALSDSTQSAPATWERVTGALGNAGYTPKGKPGGGIGSAQYGVGAMASVALATAAHVPSEAAIAVAKLEGLAAIKPGPLSEILDPNQQQQIIVPPGTTLRNYLEREITRWAAPTPEMHAQLQADIAWSSAWVLELSLSMPWANLRVHDKHSGSHIVSFGPNGPPSRSLPSARRKVELTLAFLAVAGELLRDTLARQAATTDPS